MVSLPAHTILHSKQYGRPISGHQEVCAVKGKNADSVWHAVDGVYFVTEEL